MTTADSRWGALEGRAVKVKLVGLIAFAGVVLFGGACSEPEPEIIVVTPTPVPGVLLPLPEDGSQYRMSEVCRHIEAGGYDVKGTFTYAFEPDDFSGLLENLPALARTPVENYLSDGLRIEVEARDLCSALNR